MATDKRRYTLRIQNETFQKIAKISKVENRSIAMQIEYALLQYIKSFEHENSEIIIPEDFD